MNLDCTLFHISTITNFSHDVIYITYPLRQLHAVSNVKEYKKCILRRKDNKIGYLIDAV